MSSINAYLFVFIAIEVWLVCFCLSVYDGYYKYLRHQEYFGGYQWWEDVFCIILRRSMLSSQLQWALYSVSEKITAKNIASFDVLPWEFAESTQKAMLWMEENAISTRIRGYDSEGVATNGGMLFGGQPHISYLMWNSSLLNKEKLGIVGPRTPSPYARDVMRDFSVFLWKYELVTVSGGAEGIDMIAHQYSLDMQVPTIVVLWAWIRRSLIRSTSKSFLYQVLEHGWLIYSSFKLDQCPTRFSFPQRNKYIAWMSKCLFVPEAGMRSGSLITVDFAATMRTPCYSVPQSIYASWGAWVLKAWREWKLSLIPSFETVFDHFTPRDTSLCGSGGTCFWDAAKQMGCAGDHDIVSSQPPWPQDLVSQHIRSLLEQHEPLSADEIIKILEREPFEILWCLAMWEIEWFWKELSDWTYQRR